MSERKPRMEWEHHAILEEHLAPVMRKLGWVPRDEAEKFKIAVADIWGDFVIEGHTYFHDMVRDLLSDDEKAAAISRAEKRAAEERPKGSGWREAMPAPSAEQQDAIQDDSLKAIRINQP